MPPCWDTQPVRCAQTLIWIPSFPAALPALGLAFCRSSIFCPRPGNWTALHLACMVPRNVQMIRFLLQHTQLRSTDEARRERFTDAAVQFDE